jgi:hypothetical protein
MATSGSWVPVCITDHLVPFHLRTFPPFEAAQRSSFEGNQSATSESPNGTGSSQHQPYSLQAVSAGGGAGVLGVRGGQTRGGGFDVAVEPPSTTWPASGSAPVHGTPPSFGAGPPPPFRAPLQLARSASAPRASAAWAQFRGMPGEWFRITEG